MPKADFSKLSSRPAPKPGADVLAASSSTRRLLGALIVPLELLIENREQVRRSFDPEALRELAEDITARGILEPLLVRTDAEERYEIIAGARRYRAALLAGLSEVPVLVRDFDDQAAQMAQLVENIQRENLDPHDEQLFFQRLQNEYNLSVSDIADLIHKSRMYVTRRLNGEVGTSPVREKNHETNAPFTSLEKSQDIDSEKNHETNAPFTSLEKSQMKRKLRFNKSAFARFGHVLDTTLTLLDSEPDIRTYRAIAHEVEEMEQKLATIKQKLGASDRIHGKR